MHLSWIYAHARRRVKYKVKPVGQENSFVKVRTPIIFCASPPEEMSNLKMVERTGGDHLEKLRV